MNLGYKTIDEYIDGAPSERQEVLRSMYKILKQAAPGSGEKISYGIPTLTMNGNLVHFAGYDTHIGFYPGAGAIKAFQNDLSRYKTSKGTIQFPLDGPLPSSLITRIVKYCVKQNQAKTHQK